MVNPEGISSREGTSYLVVDELGGVAYCEICGYSRRLH